MTTQQRIERIAEQATCKIYAQCDEYWHDIPCRHREKIKELLIAALTAFAEEQENDLWAKDEWLEEDGFVLWWSFPITEPPYVGTPLCSDFPGYVTHWTRIKVPSTGEKPE